MEMYCISYKRNNGNENSIIRKTKQNRLMLLLNCAVCGEKNQLLLKIKNSTIWRLNLKWIKSLTTFYFRETNFCQNCIQNSQDVLIVFVDHLLNIVKELKNLEKQVI